MPLDTIYLTRHGVSLSRPYYPMEIYVGSLESLQLTSPAPSQLDNRPPHRHLQVAIPNTNGESSRPGADIAWRATII